ncbi:heavy metal translocating p-type atpase [Colletotrichum camelliae]|nr:heavy metal translocating p-type atpase [Colletotrichum camelliae]
MMETDSTNGSRGQDGPRSRKRAAASQGKSESAAEKKRTQNRISQQCAREKQSAYIRQMESLVAALKTPNEDATEQTKYDELVKAHLKLAEEKQQVEDALFRLRQKLLSVGNLATAAAERSEEEPSSTTVVPPRGPGSAPVANVADLSASNLGVPDASSGGAAMGLQSAPEHTHTSYIQPQSLHDARSILQSPSAFLPADLTIMPSLTTSMPNWGSPCASPNLRFPFGLFDSNAAPTIMPLPFDMMSFQHLQPSGNEMTAIINNSSLFADQVKLAANHVMSKSVSTSQEQMGHPPVMANQARLVIKLASIAVEVIGALAGLEPYIYGVYFSKYMESVMRWRISNSVEDRLQIPVPFRPTPLQSATPYHPVVIDFINWPSIRDQMILYSSKLDLDAMSRDIVLNTVVELPEKRVSVNIHDVFFNHILPRIGGGRTDGSNSMLHNREWIYLKVPVNPAGGMTYTGFCSVQEALAAEMDCRMGQSPSPGSTRTHLRPSIEDFAGRSAPYGPEMVVANALAAFGIDQPSNWKLSKDFARKYPHIDCSLGLSNFRRSTYHCTNLLTIE